MFLWTSRMKFQQHCCDIFAEIRKTFLRRSEDLFENNSCKSFSSQSVKETNIKFYQLGKVLNFFFLDKQNAVATTLQKKSYAKSPKTIDSKTEKKQQRETYSKNKCFLKKVRLTHRMQFWNSVENSSQKVRKVFYKISGKKYKIKTRSFC